MRLILVRHGETNENKKNIIIGHTDAPLSKRGLNQVRKVARKLKDEKINVIYTSDLIRASETAKAIAKYHPNASIHTVKELRERNFGRLDGKKEPDNWQDIQFSLTLFKREKGEEWGIVYKRAKEFLKHIIKKHSDETVVFVTHGGIIRVLFLEMLNKSIRCIKEIGTSPNTSISIFEYNKNKKWKPLVINNIDHLE